MEQGSKSDLSIIEDIYATALGEQSWEAALNGIRYLTGARMVSMMTVDGSGEVVITGAAADDMSWAQEVQQSYNDEFRQYDPSRSIAADWRVGYWYDDRQWNSPKQRSHGVFHQEFLYPRGLGYWEGVLVDRTPELVHFLSLVGGSDGVESPSFRNQLIAIESHLVRALRMQSQIATLQGHLAEAEAALDALTSPLFVLDESRRLLRTNAAARALIAQEPALRFVNGRFQPPVSNEAAWAEACRNGMLAIQRKPPHRPLVFSLNPLPARSNLARDWQRPLTLMLGAGERSTWERQRSLCVIYGLSQAEAEVCTLICHEGLSPQKCSDARGVSIATIRTQIKAIHAKTGAARLPELVRLMAAI